MDCERGVAHYRWTLIEFGSNARASRSVVSANVICAGLSVLVFSSDGIVNCSGGGWVRVRVRVKWWWWWWCRSTVHGKPSLLSTKVSTITTL